MNPEIEERADGHAYCKICGRRLSRLRELVRDRHVANDQRKIRLMVARWDKKKAT